jgi:hypothetical protein
MLAGLIALMLAAIFTGAALYVSFVEQPARMLLEPEAALAQWQPSYKRGAVMQAGLAVIAFLAGLTAWWQMGGALFLAGAVFRILPWPWTLLVILPTNKALLAMNPARAGPESRALLEKWGRLHALRTGLGCAATLSFLVACLTFPAFEA